MPFSNLRSPAQTPLNSDSRMPDTAANDRRNGPSTQRRALANFATQHTEHTYGPVINIIDDDVPSSDRERTLLVVDAACDMPTEWLAENNVAVLPIKASIDDGGTARYAQRIRLHGVLSQRPRFVRRECVHHAAITGRNSRSRSIQSDRQH